MAKPGNHELIRWVRDQFVVPGPILSQPGGRKVKGLMVLLLTYRHEGRNDAYPSVATLAEIYGTSINTARRALNLARRCGLINWTERTGDSHLFDFSGLEALFGSRRIEPAPALPALPAPPAPPSVEPIDETGATPPEIDPSIPQYDIADLIAKDKRFYKVLDGVSSVRKRVLWALGQGVPVDAVATAFKANTKLRNSWEILQPLVDQYKTDPRYDYEAALKAGPPPRRFPKTVDDDE